ncbi:hypothetical protein [Sediminibacillus massiliensis]|uniref:hypothetical protein n=1 Tax=Sediminibacillus massiliensis TaxID=1926277 RepID=UPI0009883EA1|nr:hypothetical protein [Sediminibacillus massiliensis]
MEYFMFAIYLLLVFCLLIGASTKEKKWFGITSVSLAVVFFIGTLVIKYNIGFFQANSYGSDREDLVILGEWVLPFFIAFCVSLLILIDYRFFNLMKGKSPSKKWIVGSVAVFCNLVYLVFGYLLLFFIGFFYFPFAP